MWRRGARMRKHTSPEKLSSLAEQERQVVIGYACRIPCERVG